MDEGVSFKLQVLGYRQTASPILANLLSLGVICWARILRLAGYRPPHIHTPVLRGSEGGRTQSASDDVRPASVFEATGSTGAYNIRHVLWIGRRPSFICGWC